MKITKIYSKLGTLLQILLLIFNYLKFFIDYLHYSVLNPIEKLSKVPNSHLLGGPSPSKMEDKPLFEKMNNYVKAYKMMDEISKEINRDSNVPLQEVKMIFTSNPNYDQRRYVSPIIKNNC